ncbi:hypothetical protein, partial [Escherichia coli]
SGKNIIRWLLKKRTNGSVRYCQYTSELTGYKLNSVTTPALIDEGSCRFWAESLHHHLSGLTFQVMVAPMFSPAVTYNYRKRKLTAVCSHQTRIGNLDAHLI